VNHRCRHADRIWPAFLAVNAAVFTWCEVRAFRRCCHSTLSREAHAWLRVDRCRYSPLVVVLAALWFARHLSVLEELPHPQN
jgi:hypothetical protein